jgi:hypothetical protein
MTTALEGAEWSAARPGRTLPPGKSRYPLYRRLGGPQGWSGQVQKISPPPGFDARTVQPVAQSLYRLSYRAHMSLSYIHESCTCSTNFVKTYAPSFMKSAKSLSADSRSQTDRRTDVVSKCFFYFLKKM